LKELAAQRDKETGFGGEEKEGGRGVRGSAVEGV